MLVLERLVRVFMIMSLGQVHPQPERHECSGEE
jgi:hypothetical protein